MARNTMGKTRPDDQPYEVWKGANGWTWNVLKFYKSREATIADPFGRVFCLVEGWETEKGDVYYSEITQHSRLIHTDYPE